MNHNLKPLSDHVKPWFQKSALPGYIQESEFSEVLLCTHIYWLLFKFLSQFLVSLFLKGKKKVTEWVGFFSYKITSMTKLYAIRVAWIIQYCSDHLGKLHNAVPAIADSIQKYYEKK